MFLTKAQLIELTGRKRRDAQRSALNYMGVEHRVRPDGSLAVLESHIEKLFGGSDKGQAKRIEPNWDALNAFQSLGVHKVK